MTHGRRIGHAGGLPVTPLCAPLAPVAGRRVFGAPLVVRAAGAPLWARWRGRWRPGGPRRWRMPGFYRGRMPLGTPLLAVVATVGPFRLLRDASTRRWFWKLSWARRDPSPGALGAVGARSWRPPLPAQSAQSAECGRRHPERRLLRQRGRGWWWVSGAPVGGGDGWRGVVAATGAPEIPRRSGRLGEGCWPAARLQECRGEPAP